MAFDPDQPNRSEGITKTAERELVALYERAAQDVNELAARAFRELADSPQRRASQFRETRAALLAQQIELALRRIDGRAAPIIEGAALTATERATREAEAQIREIGLNPADPTSGAGIPGVGFAGFQSSSIEAIASDTAARESARAEREISAATRSHGTRAVSLFRSLSQSIATQRLGATAEREVNRAIARGLISGDPRIADRAMRDLFRDPKSPEREGVRKLGNKLIDVGAATMSVRQYSLTVTRTRTREATVSARHDRFRSVGVQLAQVVGATSKNFCTAFIGLVYSLDGDVTIDGVQYPGAGSLPGGGPPFHPNCSKGPTPFVAQLMTPARRRLAERAATTFQRRQAAGILLEPLT